LIDEQFLFQFNPIIFLFLYYRVIIEEMEGTKFIILCFLLHDLCQ
jgi:hypothetical protein